MWTALNTFPKRDLFYARFMDDWVILAPTRWKLRRNAVRRKGLKALPHEAWAFRPRNSPTNPRPVRSGANVGSNLAGDLSGRVFLHRLTHRAEALCFVLSGRQPGQMG